MKRKRTARRRGRWNELEEKGVEKKGRMVGWRGTIDFLIKGKLFQKVVGTKSASIFESRHRYRWWEVLVWRSECTCRESRLITHS